MLLYRICHKRHVESYQGLGTSYQTGGRWNEPRVPALYFGETASVAMLEMAHYLPSPRLVPDGYRLAVYEVAEGIPVERWTLSGLPGGWDRFPYPLHTQRMGSDWLRSGTAPLLVIPSAAVPGGLENIVLCSPPRLDATSIQLVEVHEHLYNPRAFDQVPPTHRANPD